MHNQDITAYQDFLAGKRLVVANSGIDVPADTIGAHLFPFQRDLVRWALRKGRARWKFRR